MPRLNIYIPDHLAFELRAYPGSINVSKVCAEALRLALNARDEIRPLPALLPRRAPRAAERHLMEWYRVPGCIVAPTEGALHPREMVAIFASNFIDRTLVDGMPLAMGGGAQMYEVARQLGPRNIGTPIWAVGFGQVDAQLPHVHPNAIVTLLSLLYAPRATPHLVTAPDFQRTWHYPALYPPGGGVQRIAAGSCAMFEPDSAYARMLGKEMTDFLVEENVIGDFLGVFFSADGRIVEPYAPSMPVSHIPAADLRRFSERDDAVVMLATCGVHKTRLIRHVLREKLCNLLVTADDTAAALLS
ncbi:MAG TPA: sugar-binding domain-containing protein [Gemmatimonadaceae bacterium]|nr:sugar-binding domain-containing protein [Gemmatimonadaceae bacterium]